ncbi:hypothetical protein, partial [Leptospira andrefontaineae]
MGKVNRPEQEEADQNPSPIPQELTIPEKNGNAEIHVPADGEMLSPLSERESQELTNDTPSVEQKTIPDQEKINTPPEIKDDKQETKDALKQTYRAKFHVPADGEMFVPYPTVSSPTKIIVEGGIVSIEDSELLKFLIREGWNDITVYKAAHGLQDDIPK